MNDLRPASVLAIPKTMKDNSIEFHMMIDGHIYAAGIDFEEGQNPNRTVECLAGEVMRLYLAHKEYFSQSPSSGA